MTGVDKNRALTRLAESDRTDIGRVAFVDQTAMQKTFSAVWQLESQVNNGGFDAYFRHSDSEVIAHAPTALRDVGAFRCCAIVEKALKLLEPLPSTRTGREDALDTLDDDGTLDELDREFYTYPDDLTELLYAFVSKRTEVFGQV